MGHLSFTEILDTSLKVSWQEPLEKNGIITGKGLCGQKEAKQVCPAQRDGHSSRRHGWQSPGAQGLQGDCRGAKVGGGPVPGASPHVGPSGLGCSLPPLESGTSRQKGFTRCRDRALSPPAATRPAPGTAGAQPSGGPCHLVSPSDRTAQVHVGATSQPRARGPQVRGPSCP